MTEIEIVKAIVEYSIDNSPEKNDLFELLNLNEEFFFNELFIKRDKALKKIISAIRQPGKMCIISGEKGCGKTTISKKTINSLDKKIFKIYVNFKSENKFDTELKKIKKISQSFEERKELSFTYFRKHVLNQIKLELTKQGVTDNEVAIYIFSKKILTENVNTKFREIESYLEYTSFQNYIEQIGYKNALTKCLKEDSNLRLLWLDFIRSLNIQEYATYLIDKTLYTKFVCLFDNVDSIDSLKDQSNFIHYCQKFQSEFKNIFNLLITIRTINPTWQTIYADYETFSQDNILLDYFEFIDDSFFTQHNIFRRNDYSPKERFDILEILSKEHQALSFKIIEKRIRLLVNNINLIEQAYNLSKNKLDQILDACELILANERIRNSLTNLCNGDRRTTLSKLIDFIEHLDKSGSLPITGNFRLESVFNSWLIRSANIFEIQPLDIVKSFVLDDKREILLNHLILNLISNLTDSYSIFYQYEKSLKVKSIVEELYNIGINKKRTLSALYSLLVKDDIPTGLIECANYTKIIEQNALEMDEIVWLTPRARTLKGYSIFTFNFLLSMLIENNYKVEKYAIDEQVEDTSFQAFAYVFHFLSVLGQSHILTVKSIIKNLSSNNHEKSKKDLCKEYLNNFGLNTGDDPSKNTFLFLNIISTHKKYVSGLRIKNKIKQEVNANYDALKNMFNSDIKNLKENRPHSKEGYYSKITIKINKETIGTKW